MKNTLTTSLTRITPWNDGVITERLPREQWESSDYVVVEVSRAPGRGLWVELVSGRLTHASQGDLIVGALGTRHATLEMTGSWEAVGDDGRMQLLTAAGLLGKLTSLSGYSTRPMDVRYVGHVMIDGAKANMRDYVEKSPERPFDIPVVLIVGSSMSAGKTSAARNIIRRLKRMDLKVLGVKLTGAGRYRDILTMGDAGADWIFDFVDAGMPSTVCAPDDYRRRAGHLLSRMAGKEADVAVIEAGASPLEPYNGDNAVELLRGCVRLLVLCASDPYAVVGIEKAFGQTPDVVGGAACNTIAGRELVERLTGLATLNFTDGECQEKLDALLREKLGLA